MIVAVRVGAAAVIFVLGVVAFVANFFYQSDKDRPFWALGGCLLACFVAATGIMLVVPK